MCVRVSEKRRQSDFFSVCETCQLGCCNGVRPPLTPKRKRIIQNFLKANSIIVPNPFKNRDYTFPRETPDGYCIFFDKATKKCLIHPVKPETCVAGPITFDINRQTEKIEWFLKTEKICAMAAALYPNKEAFEKHLKSAKSEVMKLVQNLDSKALGAILAIAEPDTLKFGEDALHSKVVAKLKQ